MGVHLKRSVAVRLTDLLDEAHEKSININSQKKILIWMKEELNNIARVVGIGAVKYADLSKTRPPIIFSVGSDVKF